MRNIVDSLKNFYLLLSKRSWAHNLQDYIIIYLPSSARKEFPYIIVKLLPSIDRSQGIDSAKSTMDAILKLHKKFSDIIKGIDLSGNPNVENFSNYKLIFETFRNMNLPLSLHCGEVENEEEIREMIDFGMARCGHGTFIKGCLQI